MHHISTDADNAVVTVTYRGRVTVSERTEVLAKLLKAFAATEYRRLLVDFFAAEAVIEEFVACNQLASKLVALGVQGCRVAYVGPRGHTISPVVDTLAASRGFMFERFVDHEDAIVWLKG